MTTGYFLILAILVLGGTIATVGDRIGSKVGKARLRLFHLRPRQTATLMTIVTGSIISASTLGILLALDEQLRTGIFELEELQKELATASTNLQKTRAERDEIEADLTQTRTQLQGSTRRLQTVNNSLQEAIAWQPAPNSNLPNFNKT
ncbi:MAG: DUF3084 domain-containing protein [Coleofasciculaceae cyanobacterium SM2_3_26]|nr:DUF3084 domain-containing protein [Coleofasciculaceae cyanobacterium SM2_3_26]